jgi:predicted RNA-binding Zn ribbon-like protein
MATEVQPMPMPMLVDLVNGWGTVPRARAGDRDRPAISAFAARHGAAGAGLTDAALERVADRLYAVFAADGAAERARLVSDLLTSCGVQPALAVAGDRIRAEWLVPRRRDALLAAAAVALHGQLAEHEPERLGTCASTSCGDAFADASPGAHRRFCSVTCQNRERVAAFRRRKQAGSA